MSKSFWELGHRDQIAVASGWGLFYVAPFVTLAGIVVYALWAPIWSLLCAAAAVALSALYWHEDREAGYWREPELAAIMIMVAVLALLAPVGVLLGQVPPEGYWDEVVEFARAVERPQVNLPDLGQAVDDLVDRLVPESFRVAGSYMLLLIRGDWEEVVKLALTAPDKATQLAAALALLGLATPLLILALTALFLLRRLL